MNLSMYVISFLSYVHYNYENLLLTHVKHCLRRTRYKIIQKIKQGLIGSQVLWLQKMYHKSLHNKSERFTKTRSAWAKIPTISRA
jgi:hypothetical protein